ncbi:Na/Pi cotransporter family protein [bacterium]|nr:Na/Pi cotransporter family protein [bacterium]
MLRDILLFFLGLVFFLIGSKRLGFTLQKVLGFKIRKYLEFLSKNRFLGCIFGFILAFLLQSSSAANILVVGLVGAGLVSFLGSLPVILGAGLGSTLSPFLVVFKITKISPLIIIIGGFFYLFSKKDSLQRIGKSLFYFGLMFFGLDLIGQVAKQLEQSNLFVQVFEKDYFSLIPFLIALVFTALVQASIVPISILIFLVQQGGGISLNGIIPVILGVNVGTSISVVLVSLNGSLSGKKSALAGFLFKVFGALIFTFLFPIYSPWLVKLQIPLAYQIVLFHFIFNLFLVLFFILLDKKVALLVEKLLPGKEELYPIFPVYLDKKLLDSPDKALDAVRKELSRIVALIVKMLEKTEKLVFDFQKSNYSEVNYIELVIDELHHDILEYLDGLDKSTLTKEQAKRMIDISVIVDSLERIGDRILNIVRLAKYKKEKKVVFSSQGEKEIREFFRIIKQVICALEVGLSKLDGESLRKILDKSSEVGKMFSQSKIKHLERFYQRECVTADATIFNNMLVNFVEIFKHCSKIAQL